MKIEEKDGKVLIDGLDIMQVLSNFEKECERLSEENHKLKESILNETTTHCNTCPNKEHCPENECVIYRLETLGVNEYR
jgi:hypothetical protein